MLVFNKISKVFSDGTKALKSIDLTIPKGQFCIILGPSGAGKSTLLRTVNALVKPTEGSIYLNGMRVTEKDLMQIRQKVAMIHQHFNLSLRLSVATNVLSGGLPAVSTLRALLSLFPSEMYQKCCGLLSTVGLSEYHLHRRASDLSGGQQQRVGVARAFMLEPEIILADEPVASLDPKISHEIMTLLYTSAKKIGTTVLCSMHQVDLAKKFADRLIGMREGEIVFDETPATLDNNALRKLYQGSETALEEHYSLNESPVAAGVIA